MRTHLAIAMAFAGILVSGVFAGCTAPADPEEVGEDTATASDELQLFPASRFYSVRKNTDCLVRLCTGYFIKEVSSLRGERHVDGLQFLQEGVRELALAEDGEIPDGGLILQGFVGPKIGPWEKQSLMISNAWRGMPGQAANRADGVYRIVHEEHPFDFLAYAVNTRANPERLLRLDVTSVVLPHVEHEWLRERVLHHGALVAGHMHANGSALDVNQVYLHLPDEKATCPPVRAECGITEFPTYSRDADRCYVFEGCRSAKACPLPRPDVQRKYCEEGYTFVGWRAPVRGCLDWACEPDFIQH